MVSDVLKGDKCFLISYLWLQIISCFAVCLCWVVLLLLLLLLFYFILFYGKSGYFCLMPCYYWQEWFLTHGVRSSGLILWSLTQQLSDRTASSFLHLLCYLFHEMLSYIACVGTFYFSPSVLFSHLVWPRAGRQKNHVFFFQMINCLCAINFSQQSSDL